MADVIRFGRTEKGKPVLICPEGFSYVKHRDARDPATEYWTCEQRDSCPGRGVSRENRHRFEKTKEHNHLHDPLRRELRQIKNDIKRAASDTLGATTTNILHVGLSAASAAAKARLPCMEHLKRNIQRRRNKAQVPLPLPVNRDDLQIPMEYQLNGNAVQPEQFLLWDSGPAVGGQERILMFATRKNLDFLHSCNALLMDGTFKTSPPNFLQLYSIHGTRPEVPDQKPGKAVPLIFSILPNKTEDTYIRVFNMLSDLLPGWAPERIMLDFERASINALTRRWPNSLISGCFFHLTQNIYKKIQELGLSTFYGQEVENATNLKMISALAMVPPESVVESWEELLQILLPWIEQQPENVKCKIDDLLKYFERNYIGQVIAGVRREPRVASIELWNVRQRTIEFYGRTDNEVEGFHMKVKQATGAQYPNFWKFLKSLQGLQSETEKIIAEMNAGVLGRKQRPRYIYLSERIRNVTLTWPQRQDLRTYLQGICHNYEYGVH